MATEQRLFKKELWVVRLLFLFGLAYTLAYYCLQWPSGMGSLLVYIFTYDIVTYPLLRSDLKQLELKPKEWQRTPTKPYTFPLLGSGFFALLFFLAYSAFKVSSRNTFILGFMSAAFAALCVYSFGCALYHMLRRS